MVQLSIGADGRVTHAKVSKSSGVPCLDDAAVSAAKRWIFAPAMCNGVAVASEAELPFKFVLGK
jgi:protein TonB